MTRVDGTIRPHTRVGWVVTLLIAAACAAYAAIFWGNVFKYAPGPVPAWVRPLRHSLADWYRHHLAIWVAVQCVIGMVPALFMVLARRSLGCVGLGLPNALGRRLALVSVIVSIPFGLWLVFTATTVARGVPLVSWRYMTLLLAIIPEHALICGLFVAVLLPGRRLPENVPLAPAEGSRLRRGLRWLGLAQVSASAADSRVLSWFGLTAESLAAIMWSGVIFWLAHLGKPDLAEVAMSLPGGVAVAYVTLRSRSIWPAIIAHYTMNLVPIGILALWGVFR